MNEPKKFPFWLAIGLLALSNLFCSLPIGSPTPTGISTANPASTTTLTAPATTQGNGTQEPLATEPAINQAAGALDGLTSYQASLTVTANGQNNGKPFQWTYQISQSQSSSPALTVVTAQSTGLGAGQDYNGTVLIQDGQTTLTRWSTSSPCQSEPASSAAGLTGALFSLLPDITGAVKDKSGTQEGQPADHYTLSGGGLSGDLWTAAQGGFLLQASLKQDGALEVFGPSVNGHAEWTYTLQSINLAAKTDLPASCQLLLGGVLIPPVAGNLSATDTTVQFTTSGSAVDLFSFYTSAIAKNGWKPINAPAPASGPTEISYYDSLQNLVTVSAYVNGSALNGAVSVHKPSAATEPGNTPSAVTPVPQTPGPGASPPVASSDPVKLISGSLNLTLGIGKSAPVLPSFHLEAKGADPVWNAATKKVDLTSYTMIADVSGKDVHFTYTSSVNNGLKKVTELYTVAGQSYQVVNGKTQPANPLDAVVWATWTLSPSFVLAEAANGASAQGSEDVASRPAGKYALDTASISPDILKALQGFTNISSAKGTVWIDTATGALLQADLTYAITETDKATGAVLGTGSGSFQAVISNVGGVTVKLP